MSHTLTIRPAWTPLTIVLMVLGFMFAWPLGLLMLAYILWGDRIPEFMSSGEAHRQRHRYRYGCGFGFDRSSYESGNVAFDDYRDQELKRLEEERRRLDEERREFEAFLSNLRRAKDQDEFDRFMAERRNAESEKGESKEP